MPRFPLASKSPSSLRFPELPWGSLHAPLGVYRPSAAMAPQIPHDCLTPLGLLCGSPRGSSIAVVLLRWGGNPGNTAAGLCRIHGTLDGVFWGGPKASQHPRRRAGNPGGLPGVSMTQAGVMPRWGGNLGNAAAGLRRIRGALDGVPLGDPKASKRPWRHPNA